MNKKQIIALTMLLALTTARGADVAISALPAASSINAADVGPIVQSGTTKKASFTVQKTYWDTFYQSLDGDLTALSALTGTHTIYYRSAASTWTAVTIGSGLNFTGSTLAVNTPTPTPTATPTATATATPTPTPTPTTTPVTIPHAVTFTCDGYGSVLSAGTKSYIKIPYGGTLVGWTLIASPSGSITVDILRAADGAGLPASSIVGGGGTKPALSSATENDSTSFTGWTSTTLTALDNMAIDISGVSTCTYMALTIYYE